MQVDVLSGHKAAVVGVKMKAVANVWIYMWISNSFSSLHHWFSSEVFSHLSFVLKDPWNWWMFPRNCQTRSTRVGWANGRWCCVMIVINFCIARPKYCFILCTAAVWQLWLNEHVMLCYSHHILALEKHSPGNVMHCSCALHGCRSEHKLWRRCRFQSNSSMHHCECVSVCNDISLQRGRFCARPLASCIPRSSKDRSSRMFFIQVVHGRPGGRLQFSGGGSKMACLASASACSRLHCRKEL